MKQLRNSELKKFIKATKVRRKNIVLILENIQYARNVASIFRTADAAGVEKIYLTGISKTPPFGKDLVKASRNKERSVQWQYFTNTDSAVNTLKTKGYVCIGLEITDKSLNYSEFNYPDKLALIAGNETYGIVKNTLNILENSVFIPMMGKGASLNVSTALAIVLFRAMQ